MKFANLLLAASLVVFGSSSAAAADAASCIHQCSSRCYTAPNPGTCEQACNASCIWQPDTGPAPYCGSVMTGTHNEETMGWSWGAGDQYTAQRAAWDHCVGPKAPECSEIITFCNECVAVARWRDPGGKLRGTVAGRGPNIGVAERDVAEKCKRIMPGVACKLEKRICADKGPL